MAESGQTRQLRTKKGGVAAQGEFFFSFACRKDTRHGKGLSKGVESAAPSDLPGSDVHQDEMEFEQQLTHLDKNRHSQVFQK